MIPAYGFTYNPAGQVSGRSTSNDSYVWAGDVNVSRSYSVNGLNQYTATTSNGAASAAFCYDANGNLTADGSHVYKYDIENRLTEMRVQGSGNTNCAALAYTGTLKGQMKYDPLGRLYETSAGAGRFSYTGQIYIPELGLYHYKARIYSPTLGRFLQTDPIGYEDQMNLYAYVKNDPVNNTDPTGMECNNELTECTADNAGPISTAPDVKYDPAEAQAVYDNRGDFQRPVRGGEPVGGVRQGESGPEVDTVKADSRGTTRTADTAGFRLTDEHTAGVHGHLGGSVTDEPSANGGYGDTQSLTQGKEMYTVEGRRVGVHDSPGGTLRFKMTQGSMTPKEARQIQKNLNEAQKRFNRPGPPS